MKEHPIKPMRRAGVPLACLETADPALTIAGCIKALNGKADTTPILQWDIVRGLVGLNKPGNGFAGQFGPMETQNPTECLNVLQKAPEHSLVFWLNAHNYLGDPSTRQALWNLRDTFKASHCLLLMLAPVMTLPDELKHDVVTMTEPLPSMDEVLAIIDSICKDAEIAAPDEATRNKAADALLGLSAFAAEQCLAMAIRKEGIDLSDLWERKRKMIEQTPGLSVWRGGEKFSDIGGCENVKGFMRDIMNGKRAPRAICFIDEIEKSLAGAGGDLSGTSQDQLGALLTFMQDKQSAGCIFIGPPGAAKSAVAKATGNEGNIPTISVDLGAMKGSLVGQSEKQLRQALGVIEAVSQGQTLFIATCNSFGNLPPELKRRFTLGTFFFDLPTQEEREKIWSIYTARYSLDPMPVPHKLFADEGWTGAEIRQCCDIAWRLKRPMEYAAKFIVPVAKSAADKIETLRKQASGKFISASESGVYQFEENKPKLPNRKFGMDN